ncbi:E3 ubiquitin-protein ligase HOS1-like [Silene latifolia]|uniref:E3 ubiquitin-protein ligase HOS1-like n=1 Tax=Silene latifolia TaxID=37657 RepID=UPI003D78427B
MKSSMQDASIVSSEFTNGFSSTSSSLHKDQHRHLPDYSSKIVQDALQHLASVDLVDLCNEAKVERCRASRDLRSCGRLVESVLMSCGHASLCAECSQRFENCPICRTPLPTNGNILRRRLYYECVEAGLINKVGDDKYQEIEDDVAHLTADVQRLYSLFDVAMENNLCCLICQYVTDVCMDESAVSSDPVIAFLLDEVVVKDWCKRTFKNIIKEVRGIYNLGINEMNAKMGGLLKILAKLAGLSNVLEVLDLSFKDTHAAKLDDLNHFQESISKTKQHMEMMMWCIRHQFLENVRSRHSNLASWRALVRERKSAAVNRAWPEAVQPSGECIEQDNSSLFLEDALLNLEADKGYGQSSEVEREVASLQKDGGSSFFRSKIEGFGGCYPFENVRAAIDILFLCGSSDMVVAKRAIFLYYLFDRHWTKSESDGEWRHAIDDLAATFSITRHSLLESLTFYLLDDHTDEALQEACHLLPEISSPESHPKIAKVLLERQTSDTALMFLRWCGRDGGAEVSLREAVTAVRIKVECGLLTEAFMYQRMLCTKIKEKQLKHKLPVDASENLEDEFRIWTDWVLVLVTEICCLCIRGKFVDRMIELPWNHDEEKHLHKCLLDFATTDPLTSSGSLLVVYYLQRHRYVEAFQINCKLQTVEEDFLSKNDVDEEVLHRMRDTAHWRKGLVNKSVALLPEVEQQQLKSGQLTEDMVDEADCQRDADIVGQPGQVGTLTFAPSSLQSSLILRMDRESSFQPPQDGHVRDVHSELHNGASSSVPRGDFYMNSERIVKPPMSNPRNFKMDDIFNSATPRTSAVKDVYRTASRSFQNDFHDNQLDDFFPQLDHNGLYGQFPKVSPPSSRRVMAKPTRTPISMRGLVDDSPHERYKTANGKRLSPGNPDRPQNIAFTDDVMDISWSQEANGSRGDNTVIGVQRWRSDETSDEEEEPSPEMLSAISFHPVPTRRGGRRGSVLRR